MSTLRRDINTLEQMGCVQKAYGCILYNYSAAKIIPFHVRSTINQEQKRDACAAAASLSMITIPFLLTAVPPPAI